MDLRSTWMRTLLVVWLSAWSVSIAVAATVDNLYITTVTVSDRSDAGRERAFVQALGDVAIRVSGARDAPARLGAAAGSAKRYVQRFGYLAEDQLQVGFDPRAVDGLLANAGLSIWGRERPTTLVWLQADDGTGARRMVSNATPGPERDGLLRAATLRGLPLMWPTPSSSLGSVLAHQPSAAELDAERERLGVDALLIGYARSSPQAPPTVRWQFVFDGQAHDAAGTVESGVDLAADSFAKMFAAASGSMVDLSVEVDGITNLDAYAQTLNYLEGLTLVRSVGVTEVRGETVQFRVVSRGDAETLRRAFSLDNRLTPQSLEQSAPDPQRLRLRFQAAR
ncbi:MAG: DUF2066 domain-containing protein [Steroidobacteraceae bacterium]